MDPLRLIAAVCASPGRGPCTDSERRAAVLLHDALRGRGLSAYVETDWVRPQWAPALALGAALGIAGSLIAVAEPLAGLITAGLATVALAIEAAGRAGPLRWPFPRRATQSVIVEAPRDDAITLLVCARTDAARRGLAFAAPSRRAAARVPLRPRTWVAIAAALATMTAGARLAGADSTLLGIAQFVPTVILLLSLAAALDIALSPVSPGASDSASAVAAAIAIHAELTRTPPQRLSPALVLHGAAEGDPLALARLLGRDGRRAADTVVLDVGACGIGTPVYATRHPQLARAGDQAAQALAGTATRARSPRALRRLPLLRVEAHERGIAPRSHHQSDTPDAVDPAAIDAVVDLALAAVDALDAELSAG